jgi:predicted DNA-binding transcriptional regulator YafY
MESAIERREQIAERLRLRRKDTEDNLAAEFGVTKRTIRNDLYALSLSYPIDTVAGAGGGVVWVSDNTPKPTLTEAQLQAVHSVLEFATGQNKAELERLIAANVKAEAFKPEWVFKILENGMSQNALADRLGISKGQLSKIVCGRRKPSAAVAQKIKELCKEGGGDVVQD